MRRHHRKIRERSSHRWLAATCVGVGSLACAGVASAQLLDANPPIPDVMLILDTSGSMELLMDGCNTDTGFFTDGSGGGNCGGEIPCVSVGTSCTLTQVQTAAPVGAPNGYCDGVSARTPNRWATQVQALAGSFLNNAGTAPNYSCLSLARSSGSSFAAEFSFQTAGVACTGNPSIDAANCAAPYDLNYYLNYHRPVEPIIPGVGNPTSVCAIGFQQGPTPAWNPSQSTGAGTQHEENPTTGGSDFAAAAIGGYTYAFTTTAATASAQATSTMTAATPQTSSTCSMSQAKDGLLWYGLNTIRFGMMTIDSDTAPNTGVQSVSDSTATLDLTFTDVPNGGATSNLTTGMWSYYDGWEAATALNNWGTGSPGSGASLGRPAGCSEVSVGQISYEVGGRNPAAPPWEGRMIRFPTSSTASPAANNTTIMSTVDAMRPYGSNPIAGLMDDAKYYFWKDPEGPVGVDTLDACRPQYIILFSHAAPNEDLEPYCQGGSGTSTGECPYDYPEYIAAGLAKGAYVQGNGVVNAQSASLSGAPVKTFVVGFALDSSLGDAGQFTSCKQILTGGTATADGGTTATAVNTSAAFCGTPGVSGADSGTPGNPIYASCCALARIAVNGGTSVPYFADNQTDLSQALNAILAIIVANTTTRATPVILPQVSSSNAGTNAPALFVSSFNASTNAAWSGDVQRERYTCPAPTSGPPYQYPTDNAGDDFQYNLNNSGSQTRHVIMVEPAAGTANNGCSSATCPAATIRPYVQGQTTSTPPTAADGYSVYDATEYGYDYQTSGQNATQFLSLSGAIITGNQITTNALFPSETSTTQACSYTQPGMTLNDADCEVIALGWLLGMQAPPADWKTSVGTTFPNRFWQAGVPSSPSPFGGVYHSTPAVSTPPSALLHDDTYQAFSQYYTSGYTTSNSITEPRHSVLYTATTDGLLHAFGVDYNLSDNYTFVGTGHTSDGDTQGTQNEMWSFVPPAVLPLLMNSVGGGESVLLDGAPAVKEVVYQRTAVGTGQDWHTALVAGFGQAMGGYYALDVTDPNFADRGTAPNSFGGAANGAVHTGTNSSTPPLQSAGGYMGTPLGPGAKVPTSWSSVPMGPHFLWQLTDPYLFALTGGTPAITTVSVYDPDVTTSNVVTEIGVAILPGGYATPAAGSCPRVTCTAGTSGCTTGAGKISDASPPSGAPSPGQFALGQTVRQWNATACPGTNASNPIPGLQAPNGLGVSNPLNGATGRSLTIVRLDTGEVLRTFTVLTDIPSNHPLYQSKPLTVNPVTKFNQAGRVTQAEFDSPISGTPLPYPFDVGAVAQRVFVGDEDGTIWRLDVSNPDSTQWYVEPFLDAYNTVADTNTGAALAADRAPVVGAPSLSVGRDGNVVLNFGTGDLNYIGTATNPNFTYSVSEVPPQQQNSSATHLLAKLNWYLPFQAGEMITGPTTVFDSGYYFATFRPSGGSACTAGGAYLWGMDYTLAADGNGHTQPVPTVFTNGGVYKLTASTSTTLVNSIAEGNAIIPGVTITSSLSCATAAAVTDPATGGPVLSSSSASPPTYSLSALVGAASGATTGGASGASTGAAVSQVNITVAVHSSTLVDSWAAIVE